MPVMAVPAGRLLLDIAEMKRRREALGLSQSQAAKRADFSAGKSHWNDIETGRRANVTLDTLDRIAAALACDAADLLIRRKR